MIPLKIGRSRGRVIIGIILIAILAVGIDSALGVTTISNTIISGVTAFISSAADPADAGVLRLGNAETICWEASPASTDVCIQADANEDLLLDTAWNNVNLNSNPITNAVLGGSLNANGQTITALASLASNSGDPADAGVVRYGNAEQECWEASPAGTDQCIGNNTTEDFVWDTNWNNIDFNSNPITNALLLGGQTLKSSSATEIGIQVTNAALTVGSLGTIAVPVKTSAGAPSDAEGGDVDGSMVFNTADNTMYCRDGSAWLTCGTQYVVKTADETVNNSTTFQDDDELFFNCAANKVYGFSITIFMTTTTVADIKFTWTIPASASGDFGQIDDTTNAATTSLTGTLTEPAVANTSVIKYEGRVITAGTAGTCQLQWAQNTLAVSNTQVLKGSYITIWES